MKLLGLDDALVLAGVAVTAAGLGALDPRALVAFLGLVLVAVGVISALWRAR